MHAHEHFKLHLQRGLGFNPSSPLGLYFFIEWFHRIFSCFLAHPFISTISTLAFLAMLINSSKLDQLFSNSVFLILLIAWAIVVCRSSQTFTCLQSSFIGLLADSLWDMARKRDKSASIDRIPFEGSWIKKHVIGNNFIRPGRQPVDVVRSVCYQNGEVVLLLNSTCPVSYNHKRGKATEFQHDDIPNGRNTSAKLQAFPYVGSLISPNM